MRKTNYDFIARFANCNEKVEVSNSFPVGDEREGNWPEWRMSRESYF